MLNGRLARAGLYAGGFLGPFGGAMTSSILPEIGADFDRSAGAAAATLTYYLIPFAGLMLVSGTLGQRWGPQRTVRTAYVVYAIASALCATAWAFEILIGLRAVQGAANAFVTPVLLAALASTTPKERLGSTLGLFASMQAAGQTSAPLVGGLAAEASWRWAFVGAAVVATALAVLGVPKTEQEERPSLKSAFVPTTLRAAAVAFVGWGCLGGLGFMVAFRLDDTFHLGSSGRGLLLTGFGVAGFLTARYVGRAIDRFDARRCIVGAAIIGAGLVAVAGTAPALIAVGLAWALTGAASQGVLVGLNTLILGGGKANRGGAVSVVQSLRFLGAAVAPVAFVPLYQVNSSLAFLVPAALLVLVPPTLLRSSRHAA